MTAAPTLADVLDRLSSRSFGKTPDAVYFEGLIDALQQAYAARLEGLGAPARATKAARTTSAIERGRHRGVARRCCRASAAATSAETFEASGHSLLQRVDQPSK